MKKAEFIEKGSFPTPQDTIENFVESIGMIYDKYQERISGIAMSMPGRIDSERGYLYTGGTLEYNYDKNIVEILSKRCPKRITVENDGKCAALAEAWKGNLSDCDDGIVVILGTAIGGGISKQDILLEYIEKNIDIISKKLPYIIEEPKIVRCKFDNDSNLIGALSVYMTSMN